MYVEEKVKIAEVLIHKHRDQTGEIPTSMKL